MELAIITETQQLKNFISETAQLTDVYRGIQRNYVWGENSRKGYNKSLNKKTAVGSFVLANVETCFEKAKQDGNVSDMEFFDGFLKRGYEYISIDGNNRTQFIVSEYGKHIKEYRNSSSDIRNVLNFKVKVDVINYATKEDLHQIAIDINSNTSWNKQETRNAILGNVSNYIRGISDKMEPVSLKIKEINVNRLGDDEMYATFLYYSQHMSNSISPKNITTMYVNNSELVNLQIFEKAISIWGKVIDKLVENKTGRMKSISHNLFYFLWEVMYRDNRKFNEDTINEFSQMYVDLENERLRTSIDTNSGINLWYEINRTSTNNIDKKVIKIVNDFGDDIDLYFFKKDSVRAFKVEDKLRKCIETDGVINRLDGSVEIITPLQSMDGDLIEGDHIVPHSKGGETNADTNLELLTKSDNRKKKDKVLE
jgi:hypothetical protein